MIDFRYHLVSLIAVFMALAVGIVIGAGPLRDYLAEELSGQVDQLRVEKEELRTDLDDSEAARAQIEQFIAASGPQLVQGALEGRAIAVIQLPGADSDTVEAVITTLEQSGAQVVNRTEVTDTWTEPGQRAFRSGIAGNIAAYLNPQPADDASTEWILGAALGQALTLRDPEDLSQTSAEAQAMYDLLVSSELIGEVQAPAGPAYASVVVGSGTPTDLDDVDTDALAEANAVLTSSLNGLAQTGEGNVIAGAAGDPAGLIAAVRDQESLASSLTSVDGIDSLAGQYTVPLALAQDIDGLSQAYGTDGDAAQVLPGPVALDPPDPDLFAPGSPDAPADPDGDDTGGDDGDGADADGDDPNGDDPDGDAADATDDEDQSQTDQP